MEKELAVILFFLLVICIFVINFVEAVQLDGSNSTFTNITSQRNFYHLDISDPNLILYMPLDIHNSFNNKTYDYTNNFNDGFVTGASFNSSGGLFLGAYEFNGSFNYIEVPKISSSLSLNNTYTISLWFKLNTLSQEGYLFSTSLGNYDRFYIKYDTSIGEITGGYYDGAWYSNATSFSSANTWTHVLCTVSNHFLDCFLNNVSMTSTEVPGGSGAVTTVLGAAPNFATSLNGTLDEIMIFDKVLNETEISEIYSSQHSKFYSSGEMFFESLNLSEETNVSIENCYNYSGSFLQGKLNDESFTNFSNCTFDISSFSGDDEDVNFTIKLVSEDSFYTPIVYSSYVLNLNVLSNGSVLTWPPSNYSDGFYGAGTNPTGNPIGGFIGYNRIVNPSDAEYYVNTMDDFEYALDRIISGEVIYINDSVELDFSNYETSIYNSNITIASGRGRDSSLGAVIKKVDLTSSYPRTFRIYGSNVRFTGLRFYGGSFESSIEYHSAVFYQDRDEFDGDDYIYVNAAGILTYGNFLEVDNSEFYGWELYAVAFSDNSLNNSIHHNYFHHNAKSGTGYGVEITGWNATVLVEANLFNHNRHSISGSFYDNSYEARYNIQLSETMAGSFDKHPDPDGVSGDYISFHHNSFYTENGSYIYPRWGVGIGSPTDIESGGQIYNNWFETDNLDEAIITKLSGAPSDPPGAAGTNYDVYNNLINFSYHPYSEPFPFANATLYNASIGETITFDASNSSSDENSIRYVKWDFADNTSSQYGTIVNHSFSEAGKYKVKVNVFDQIGFLNWTYLDIFVSPEDSDKTYLDFWIFENSDVDSPEYVQKQAVVDGNILWQQNFSDNVTRWQHINVEIPSSLMSDNALNVSLGVKVLENYTSPTYPERHEIEFFEVYFDQVSVLKDGADLVGSDGDFEEGNDWFFLNLNGQSAWANSISSERKINGEYGHKIAPFYRGNYTEDYFYFVGLNVTIPVVATSNNVESTSSDGSYPIYTPSSSQIKEGYTKTVIKNSEIKMNINEQTYTAIIKSIDNDDKKVEVELEEIGEVLELDEGSIGKIDLDDDGYYDLQISLNRFGAPGYAELEFKEIHEEVSAGKQEEQEFLSKVKLRLEFLVAGGIILLIAIIYLIKGVYNKKQLNHNLFKLIFF